MSFKIQCSYSSVGWKLGSKWHIYIVCPWEYCVPSYCRLGMKANSHVLYFIHMSSKIQCSYLIVDWGITCRIHFLYTVYCMPLVIQCSYLTRSVGWGGRIYVLYVYCIPMMIQWSYLTVGWGVRIHVLYIHVPYIVLCSVRQCSHTLF